MRSKAKLEDGKVYQMRQAYILVGRIQCCFPCDDFNSINLLLLFGLVDFQHLVYTLMTEISL